MSDETVPTLITALTGKLAGPLTAAEIDSLIDLAALLDDVLADSGVDRHLDCSASNLDLIAGDRPPHLRLVPSD